MTDASRGPKGRLLRLNELKRNARQQISAVRLLGSLPDRTVALAFLDPQYRAVLDKQGYGNEGARQKGRHALKSMSDDDISFLVEEIARVLKPSGHLALWVDKFSIGSGHHLRYFRRAADLRLVEVIHWDKLRMGMGARARCFSEYCVVFQRLPTKAKGIWTNRGFPDSWREYSDRSVHTHAKPYQFTEQFIKTVTKRGDLVIDPAAGGYGVLTACQSTGREFIGGDLI